MLLRFVTSIVFYVGFFYFLTACSLPEPEVPQLPQLATRSVRITTGALNQYHCSGVAIHKNWALSAAHCYDDQMQVEGVDVSMASIPNAEWDMLLLYAPGLESGGDVVWASSKPELHSPAILVGWGCDPNHKQATVKMAHLIEIDERDLYYDKTNCPGDSGGAAYDLDGRLIGLMVRQTKLERQAIVQYLAE